MDLLAAFALGMLVAGIAITALYESHHAHAERLKQRSPILRELAR